MRPTSIHSLLALLFAIVLGLAPSVALSQDESAPGSTTPPDQYAPAPASPTVDQPAPAVPPPAPSRDEYVPPPYPRTEAAPGSPTDDSTTRNKPANYVLLKGGIYSPSTDVDVDNIDFGKKAGGAAELAVGHYFLPMLAVELGAGYFQSKNSPAAASGTMLRVVPVVATGKLLIPIGVFEPYGLFGIGGYISDLDVTGNVNNFRGSTEITFGLHAGAGFNVDLAKNMFVGAEGKYLWAKPEFGGRPIKLDGFITTVDVGFRF